ncbi:hypothetical protein [Marivirga harenae]|uniref:hypothetical protein n=1 Tax=Marivirga harenae TaxID=2010992 RepID=UPI0026DEA7C3|nr:hypothetical protein [Marivirga harenae]WKV13195.1 hypothetical protein Q3Y49_05055 [Marivirga harenae]
MKNLTLAVVALLALGFLISCQEEEMKLSKDDVKDPDAGNQKAMFPNYGWIDIDIELPSIRGWVRIYPVGPCEDEFGNPIPCDPVAETIIPCQYPNGFCYQEIVTGTTPGGGSGDPVEIEKGDIGTLYIALNEREMPNYEEVLRQLKGDDEVEKEDLEILAKNIVNTFSFAEDSPLSEELVKEFRGKSKNPEIEKMMILAGDYEIEYSREYPYGFIEAYVKAL